MFDEDFYNTINDEEMKIALEGAYSDGSLVGELKEAIDTNPWEYLGSGVY